MEHHKKYNVILADPPWKYNFARQIKDRPNKMQIVETHYPTMNLSELKNLNIESIIDKNCVLFLWVTSPKLDNGLELLKSWGFEYITSMVWDKINMGMGYWTRVQHEFILIGRRGKVSPPRLQRSSIINIKRFGHSKKPKEIYEIIEEMFPKLKKIELFAREKREGWDCFGNEVESDVQLIAKSKTQGVQK